MAATPDGASAVFGQLAPMMNGLDDAARSLSPAEREVVAGYLARVIEVLERTAGSS